jgi:nicotinic acid mononucleotide adenylyltransferase
MQNNKKIVVLTGSFNPVTKAHFEILSKAVDYLNADKGLFVATNDQYLTKKTVVEAKTRTKFFLSEEVRREMLESLNKENNKLFFGGFELGGVSPATDKTLRKVIREN